MRDALVASTVVAEPVREPVSRPVVERDERSPIELAIAAPHTALPKGEADPAQERQGAAPFSLQKTIVEAEQPRSSRRYVDGVPIWGDSEAWPLTEQDHAERDAYYTSRRDLSEDDRCDYNTVVLFHGQPPPEKRAARQEQTRSRGR